jgi:general secretion pathway protein D
VRFLRYRSASVIAEILAMKFNQSAVAANHVGIWVDERTNQIITRAPPGKLEAIRSTIEQLDRPTEGEGRMRVVRILNRDVEQVGELLLNLQKGGAGQARRSPQDLPSGGAGEGLAGRIYSVTVDPATRSLVLISDPETLTVLLEVIAQLDRLPARIAIDILVFELYRPRSFEIGLEYFLPLLVPSSATSPAVFLSSGGSSVINSTGILSTGVPSLPSSGDYIFGRYTRAPLQLSFDPGGGADPITILVPREDVAFKAGEFQAETNILMRPHILAMSGEEHEIFVGSEIPVPQGSSAPAETEFGSLTNRQIIERRDVGIELRVKPTLGAQGRVILDLQIKISELQSSIAGSVEQVGPTFTQRTLESTLILGEGEYAILGTSSGGADLDIKTGVPFLKDIPFFGSFFGSVKKTRIETDFLVVVEASIMRSPSEDVADTIRRRIAMERAMSRVSDLRDVDAEPFAVLVDTVDRESRARGIAEAFTEDGFETRVTDWLSTSGRLWDIYLTDFESFARAGRVARSLFEAGWSPEVTLLSPENAMAGD